MNWAPEMGVRGWVLRAPLKGCRKAPTAHPELTIGQQVEHQFLVSTEAGIVPDGRGEDTVRPAGPPARPPRLSARPGTHSGVLSHLSRTFTSTSRCSSRYLGRGDGGQRRPSGGEGGKPPLVRAGEPETE